MFSFIFLATLSIFATVISIREGRTRDLKRSKKETKYFCWYLAFGNRNERSILDLERISFRDVDDFLKEGMEDGSRIRQKRIERLQKGLLGTKVDLVREILKKLGDEGKRSSLVRSENSLFVDNAVMLGRKHGRTDEPQKQKPLMKE